LDVPVSKFYSFKVEGFSGKVTLSESDIEKLHWKPSLVIQ